MTNITNLLASRVLQGIRRSMAAGITAIAITAAWVTPTAAMADAFCSSTGPARVITYNDGRVTILAPWRGDYIDVCNMNTVWKGVSTTTCLAWFSQISNAYTSGKGLLFYYFGIAQGDCATMPLYSDAPPPGYVTIS